MQKSSGNEAGRKSLTLLPAAVSVTPEHERGVGRRVKLLKNTVTGENYNNSCLLIPLEKLCLAACSPLYNFAVNLAQLPPVVSQLCMCITLQRQSQTWCQARTPLGYAAPAFALPYTLLPWRLMGFLTLPSGSLLSFTSCLLASY